MMNLLIILVLILGVIAIAQLTKVHRLTQDLRKTREEEITHADNKLNANLWLVWMFLFFTGTIYLYIKYGDYLPDPASEHGKPYDNLMLINMWIITVMFFIINGALFYLVWKYYYRKERKARFFVHDSRLEMLWTMIPGVLMAFIIVYGLIIWNKITGPASPNAMKIELYSKQFDWTARYPGTDGVFGAANFNIIDDGKQNPLGIITRTTLQTKLDELENEINGLKQQLEANSKLPVLPKSKVEAIEDKIYRLQRQKQRIMDLDEYQDGAISGWVAGSDDKLVKGELHLPLGKEIEFVFHSRDVIHSAYMPHFRAQMNTVPGVPTRFKMTPTISTAEMREKLGDPKFDYILLCNKVCGAAHFNMQMKVIVEDEASYNKWLSGQKTFAEVTNPAPPAAPAPTAPADTTQNTAASAGAISGSQSMK